jgi:penicillin-binding protein 2
MMFGDGQRHTMPAQFALRVAILSGLALAIFSLIFFRLWYLEVLSGDRYLAEANNNQIRNITVQAPRGEILDRDGKVLVDNRTALALQVRTTELPQGQRRRRQVFERLTEVAGISRDRIEKEIRIQTKEAPSSPVTLKRDVPYNLVYFLRENRAKFPGVSVDRIYVRRYPQGTLASHILGYVREVNEDQLDDPRFQSLEPGDGVGQAGVESTYDSLIRGINGSTRVQVDARGRPTGGRLSVRQPKAGNDLRLTIDSDLQEVGESELANKGLPGAFAALDVRTGEVLALGSYPTFDPSLLARPSLPASLYQQIFGDPSDPDSTLEAPAFNRAIQGGYPTGSTFKLITAMAALNGGLVTANEIVSDPGVLEVGGIEFKNAGDAINGDIDLRQALKVSSDVYFYKLGLEGNTDDPEGGVIQDWARQLGLGALTGIDLPVEAPGVIPTPEWRNELYAENLTDRPWSVGDSINLSVGQGDLQANPLQMAVAYATVANGGKVVRPHVGLRVEDPSGRVIQDVSPAPRRELEIDRGDQQAILDGLEAAAMEPGGTSEAVFGGFPIKIAGKTGTAERGEGREDQSWYVALAPYPDPEIAIAFTFERGGFGADTAAPATAEMLTEHFDIKPQKIEDTSDVAPPVFE